MRFFHLSLKMVKNLYHYLALVFVLLLSSCQKDDTPKTDYSIESNKYFELISQHENGWIKEARYGSDEPTKEYEYYENGFIKSAKIYSGIPNHHLYMEVSRSEDNKPLWSKYYNPDGSLWFETIYENGQPLTKKVFSEDGTTIYNYNDGGDLISVNFTSSDNLSSSEMVFNSASEERTLTVIKNGKTLLQQHLPYQEKFGSGMNTNTYMPLGNPFGISETSYIDKNESLSQSPVWQFSVNPLEYMYPYRLFDGFFYNNYRPQAGISLAITDELYQSIIEQYPVTEDVVLVGGVKYPHGYDNFTAVGKVGDSLKDAWEENKEVFELKYGNQYVSKVGYGKTYIIVGAIRNLPTHSNAANDIKELARLQMQHIIYDHESLNPQEQRMLGKVWFEIKFFSTLKEHRNGIPLNSYENYLDAVQQVENA
ncbi:hypothetical protein OQ279_01485 [Salinimicrobium sp. MT39]|uniref:Uncharacterized protein n=1 Tax=Salinimicrobium profundisediminis TaxID=2994553 RepID=A0A9X3HZS9_9FLAO|nr:hypothetical protein [Salinimicrobium profundisediminis]MCX2836809.1 hypothetical protein [Salinimicrobium profundisediminis]